MRTAIPLLVAMLAATAAPGPASAQDQRNIKVSAAPAGGSKVALVIGNSGYADSPLKNPANDARAMSDALRELGFKVIHRADATNEGMKRAIRDFGDELRRADVGLFYYAGHGVQTSGRNYLIPVDAEIRSEAEVEYESVDVGFVIAQMETAATPLNIVILDACRNNPFARSFRSAERGLTQVTAPTGTLIAYATAPGSVASDGSGDNGLYTQELLRFMRTPGLDVEDVFKQVRISLIQQTDGQQTPWESSSLVGDFYFAEPVPQTAAAAPEAAAPPAVAVPQTRPNPAEPISDPSISTDPVADRPAATGAEAVRSEETGPPAPAQIAAAVTTCVATLADADLERFDRHFPAGGDTEHWGAIRKWVKDAPGRSAERGADLPGGVQVTDDGTATAGILVRLSWRRAFGGQRSAEVPMEIVLTPAAGGWQLQGCRVTGATGDLR